MAWKIHEYVYKRKKGKKIEEGYTKINMRSWIILVPMAQRPPSGSDYFQIH